MVKTLSHMLPLGTKAPPLNLPDFEGRRVSLNEYAKAKGYLVMFICNHCPYVIHIRHSLAEWGQRFQEQGIAVFGVNANDIENYPEDRPERMQAFAKENGFTFPYLFDASQEVAKAYQAACTPDIFLFDAQQSLVYRGQWDDSRPGNDKPIDGKDIKNAVQALLAGQAPISSQQPSMGCNIKWKLAHH